MKNWRVILVLSLFFLISAAITSRLVYLQVLKHDFYKALAQGQQKEFRSLTGERGRIFFKDNQILATNVKKRYVFASPAEIKDKEETAQKVSDALNIDKEEVLVKMEKTGLFEKIKLDITEQEYDKLKELSLDGIYISEDVFREYPQKMMASHIIGFLGGEGFGQYGVEGYYDDCLKGIESFEEIEKGFSGYFSDSSNRGCDIVLSIDYNIQFMAEKLLEEAKEGLDIEGGQIIVINPNTGKLYALASYPNFDPNDYSEIEDLEIFQDPAIQSLFEPGSVFKPITMAGALDKGKVSPDTIYYDSGVVKVGGWKILNYGERSYGEMTMTEVLEKSINTGAVFAERQLGHENFIDYTTNFGFFEPTNIDLQGEVFSENTEFKHGYEINFVTASFGQGIEITPIQLVRAFSSIANGGKIINPSVVNSIVENGKKTIVEPKITREDVISKDTVSDLTEMLVSVLENGFSKSARVEGYYIAGKTGTAEITWSSLGINEKGYSDKTWQSFIGFAPAYDPRFLILVKLDNPKAKTAEYSAVPVFKELAKYIFDYLEIPPDYELSK